MSTCEHLWRQLGQHLSPCERGQNRSHWPKRVIGILKFEDACFLNDSLAYHTISISPVILNLNFPGLGSHGTYQPEDDVTMETCATKMDIIFVIIVIIIAVVVVIIIIITICYRRRQLRYIVVIATALILLPPSSSSLSSTYSLLSFSVAKQQRYNTIYPKRCNQHQVLACRLLRR